MVTIKMMEEIMYFFNKPHKLLQHWLYMNYEELLMHKSRL